MLNLNNFSKIALLLLMFSFGCKEFIEPPINKKNVVLLAPANGTESTLYNQTFWWEEVEDALKYRLQIVSPNFDQTARLIMDTLVQKNKFSYTLEPGNYEWRVRAENGSSKTAYVKAYFSIFPSSINQQQVQLLSPANNTMTNEPVNIFKWLKLFGADKYRLQIDTNSFADETQLFLDKTLTNQELTVVFSRNKTYEWRVQAKNDTETSKWSGIQKITFDKSGPTKVTLSSPANNALVTRPVSLKWEALASAKKYQLFVYKSNGETPYEGFPLTLTTATYSFTGGILGEKLFWAVKAIDGLGNVGPISESRSFSIQ
ncbi:hypothetical protein [Pedobacter steynii]|uniref:Fibronectin type-III domain-containing protein n=1 Tax=Pedobacter steynii TaxID=430522 RepID=A0A1D7QCX8_9SPHI|nr:hypothetical protein [Pedobacter steynii]AOM76532.1 hypothetical protein BFS30_04805 [Pedobacter steynii]